MVHTYDEVQSFAEQYTSHASAQGTKAKVTDMKCNFEDFLELDLSRPND